MSVQRLVDQTKPTMNGDTGNTVVSAIPTVSVTVERRPFHQDGEQHLDSPGTARANIAASAEAPEGTKGHDWATRHEQQTVLQQHCDFFDADHDGIIWPMDTFRGFHKLGFGILLSLLAVFIIHSNFSYPTLPTFLPDPFFRIHVRNIHKDKHGSDSGVYDPEGRFIPQKFEDIFSKYAGGKDNLTIWDVSKLLKGQRCIADPIGWGGAFFEWLATYIILWPEDGKMRKEDIRGIYDGSIFYTIAARRAKNEPASSGDMQRKMEHGA